MILFYRLTGNNFHDIVVALATGVKQVFLPQVGQTWVDLAGIICSGNIRGYFAIIKTFQEGG